jgi:hypothetical protein
MVIQLKCEKSPFLILGGVRGVKLVSCTTYRSNEDEIDEYALKFRFENSIGYDNE